jgi:hypothetical protein
MFCPDRFLFAMLAAASAALCQSNVVPGRDLRLLDTWAIHAYVRSGAYPNGLTAIGAWTTICNPGTSPVPFQAAMSPNHAFIHYLVARESGGRLVQISNWSYVKHTFGSSNDPSTCGNCAGPGLVQQVEVGCSDTYANSQAVDHYNLGPPDEIDPWLGTWVPACSLFDRGDPPVAVAQQCDSLRSLTQTQANALNNTIHNQMRVHDSEFATPGTFWWQAGYLVPMEADAVRGNNIGSHGFTPTWTGTNWSLSDVGSILQGTILQRWTGATITSNSNGNDDGRFYVAVKVTGPTNGVYHYEYAVHNRDNKRGLGSLRIPVCPDAVVSNFGFHDVDRDPLNDWSHSVTGGEIRFWTPTTNAERWNSIFNFWFDCDAAPTSGVPLSLDQYDIGPGALTVSVTSTAPTGLYNQVLGPGCGTPAPTLFAIGAPARALIPNASFTLRSIGNPASAMCAFVMSTADGTLALSPGCTLYSQSLSTEAGPFMIAADGSGAASMPVPVPNIPSLEGMHIDFQMANIRTGGAFLGTFDISNGLRVRVGVAITSCP